MDGERRLQSAGDGSESKMRTRLGWVAIRRSRRSLISVCEEYQTGDCGELSTLKAHPYAWRYRLP
jgi:hypothetical protein